jgi:hypothetical protein
MFIEVKRGKLQPGDVVVDKFRHKPLFTVESVQPARARGYVVVFGKFMVSAESRTLAGHKDDLLPVERRS